MVGTASAPSVTEIHRVVMARLVILGLGLLAIVILLILPEVDPLDAAGAEATSATLMVRWQVPTPVVCKPVFPISPVGISRNCWRLPE
jgi:hypothetical protein